MTLNQQDNIVTGEYEYYGVYFFIFSGTISGEVEGFILTGTLDEQWKFDESDDFSNYVGYFYDWVISYDGSSFEGSVTWDDGGPYPWWGTRE